MKTHKLKPCRKRIIEFRSLALIKEQIRRYKDGEPTFTQDKAFRIKVTNLMVQLVMTEGKPRQAYLLINNILKYECRDIC